MSLGSLARFARAHIARGGGARGTGERHRAADGASYRHQSHTPPAVGRGAAACAETARTDRASSATATTPPLFACPPPIRVAAPWSTQREGGRHHQRPRASARACETTASVSSGRARPARRVASRRSGWRRSLAFPFGRRSGLGGREEREVARREEQRDLEPPRHHEARVITHHHTGRRGDPPPPRSVAAAPRRGFAVGRRRGRMAPTCRAIDREGERDQGTRRRRRAARKRASAERERPR